MNRKEFVAIKVIMYGKESDITFITVQNCLAKKMNVE